VHGGANRLGIARARVVERRTRRGRRGFGGGGGDDGSEQDKQCGRELHCAMVNLCRALVEPPQESDGRPADGDHNRRMNTVRRINAYDWPELEAQLEAHGNATLPRFLSVAETSAATDWYARDEFFRSRVIMGRHGFGKANTSISVIHCRLWYPSYARPCIRGCPPLPIAGTRP